MSLFSRNGTRTDLSIRLPASAGQAMPDGSGYLLVIDAGAAYDARGRGLHRVTAGRVLAVGPTRWLTRQCDRATHCVNVVVDPGRDTRHVLSRQVDVDANEPIGVISPDGMTAAVPTTHPTGTVTLRLLDLASGSDRPLALSISPPGTLDSEVAWSPDSRWLFVTTAAGNLVAVDERTGRARGLGVELPRLTQLAVRPSLARPR
jgi:hypothetical protein